MTFHNPEDPRGLAAFSSPPFQGWISAVLSRHPGRQVSSSSCPQNTSSRPALSTFRCFSSPKKVDLFFLFYRHPIELSLIPNKAVKEKSLLK